MEITYVQASVLADALNMLESALRSGCEPWATYDGDDDAGPENRDAYLAAVATVRPLVERAIENAEVV